MPFNPESPTKAIELQGGGEKCCVVYGIADPKMMPPKLVYFLRWLSGE